MAEISTIEYKKWVKVKKIKLKKYIKKKNLWEGEGEGELHNAIVNYT